MKHVTCGIFLVINLSILTFTIDTAQAQRDLPDETTITADELTSPLQHNPRPISLEEVIQLTVQNNLNIKIVEYDQDIARYGIGAAYGIFDPTLYMSYERRESEEKNLSSLNMGPITIPGYGTIELGSSSPPVVHNTEKVFVASLSQLLPTGAVLSLSYNATRFQTNNQSVLAMNPYYSNRATLSAKQPLLRNAGSFVTKSGIYISQITQQITDDVHQGVVIDILAQSIKTYWDLVFAVYNYEVHKVSLQQAEELLRTNRIKYEAGVLPATDVLQAEAQVAARQDQIILAEKIIYDLSDALKKIMNISRTSNEWQLTLVPRDTLLTFEKQPVDEEKALVNAALFRPDYAALQKEREINDIQKRVAKNQVFPELNIYGAYGFSGTDNHYSSSIDELETLDYNNWQAGIEFIFPILNRKARNELKQAESLAEKTDTRLSDLEQTIRLDVRNAIRRVRTNLDRIPITRKRVEFETAKLNDEQRRYEVGVATIQDVLQFQTDLANARALYLRAITNYLQSLVELQQVTGTILRDLGIEIQPTAPQD